MFFKLINIQVSSIFIASSQKIQLTLQLKFKLKTTTFCASSAEFLSVYVAGEPVHEILSKVSYLA